MPRIEKQALVDQDLIEIWLYTFDEWGEKQADEYLDDLNEAFHILAEQPLLCRERNELSPPVRIHHHAHHLIVYLAMEDGINLVRILHENMDIENQLKETGINQGAGSDPT